MDHRVEGKGLLGHGYFIYLQKVKTPSEFRNTNKYFP